MNVAIRKAARKDIPAILDLYAQPDMDDGKALPIAQAEKIFDRIERYPSYAIYLAETAGQAVGVYSLLIMDLIAHQGTPSGLVEDVVVHAAWRGRGIGKRMMEHALETCREADCYKLALSSNKKREAAHRFYESLGFERHGYSFVMPLTGDS